MRILLDTHAFIWFSEDDTKLDQSIKIEIEKSSNLIFLSIASLWEMAIKMQLNKLKINKSIEEIIELATFNGFNILPILTNHIIKLTTLDFFHRDPFDRMIIAQGLEEKIKIVSRDNIFDRYGVDRIWK